MEKVDLTVKEKFPILTCTVLTLIVLLSVNITVLLYIQQLEAIKMPKECTTGHNPVNLPKTLLKPGSSASAPVCPIVPHETADGKTDNYHWLELSHQEKSAPVAGEHRKHVEAYLNAENEYAETKMNENLTKKLYNEITGRLKKGDSSHPYHYKGWYYSERYEEGSEYPVYERRQGTVNGQLQKLLNVTELAKNDEYFAFGVSVVSPNSQSLAYSFDTEGSRKYVIKLRNLDTEKMFADEIRDVEPNFVWAKDSKSIFYIKKERVINNENSTIGSFTRVLKHILCTAQQHDQIIFEEKDTCGTFDISLFKTKSEKYLGIKTATAKTMTEISLLDLDNENAGLKVFQQRSPEHIYDIFHAGNRFYILTISTTETFCLMSCPEEHIGQENWKLEIPYKNDTQLSDASIFKNFLVLQEKKRGVTVFHVFGLGHKKVDYYIKFPDQPYNAYLHNNYDNESDVLRFKYSTMKIPESTFDFDLATRKQTLLQRDEVVGGYNSTNYVTQRINATARDGGKVPMSLVYRKDVFDATMRDGSNPTLLYAGGAYHEEVKTEFQVDKLSLLDRGFIYAIAHVRGRKTAGESKQSKKINAFTDFNDCARYLIDKNYTHPGKLFAMGEREGGLLIGTIINMEPQLYKGVFVKDPLLDEISTTAMWKETVPLYNRECQEREEKDYNKMLSYSVYDNVVAQYYPNILVTTAYHNPRMKYWQSAKWVAKLRASRTDDHKLFFLTNMDSRHPVKLLEDLARAYAFFLDLVGMNN